ncbi:MAG: threonine ammonia-lyase IlvA [Rikenellaceae bacterium]|nr:threonine ammonia-lyase IlvA [Rikenellaceae bacterium]
MTKKSYFPAINDIVAARMRIGGVAVQTPLTGNMVLSERYGADIRLKREDLQIVRSYKIRGAYNKMAQLSDDDLSAGVVCASAGNHAQGVAYSCQALKCRGTIYMPTTTPRQKIDQVRMFGKDFVDIVLTGDTFDDSNREALSFARDRGMTFIHPFDDPKTIEGQATVGMEIIQEATAPVDYLFVPIGGGGLASGVGSYFKQISPSTKVIGVEPAGAASMKAAIEAGHPVKLPSLDNCGDGAAGAQAGEYTVEICRQVLDDIVTVPEGKVCTAILELYNRSALVAEPAGALSIAALDAYADEIKGKTVVCVVSGSNNDITRTEEIRERSLLYEGLKHYFVVRFPQRSGALLNFLQQVLGKNDDITHFAYSKKNNREQGPALVGIELQNRDDLKPLLERMSEKGFVYEYLNEMPDLFQFLF